MLKDYRRIYMLCLGNAVMLNNWLPEGQQICKDLELTLYSQFEEIVISCLKSIFFFTSGMLLNNLRNLRNKFNGATE